ncbi:MAG TPA: hypothetical protein ENI85_02280 [Deltaproteobacteria bacterium]|nr:hypothetical protein [Deltaproteobacteria bacterium]
MAENQEAASAAESGSRQLVTFRVQTQCYAVPIESVVEMTLLRELEPIVGAPSWIRGMMQLRDSVVPIMDLRLRLGLTDLREEVIALEKMLQERKKDHIIWLQTLEEACASGKRFELQKDPTQCGFGLWFYAFKTEDAILANQVAKFEAPHNRIHALADHCLRLSAKGDKEAAQREIDLAREVDLSDMIRLFDITVREIKERSRQMVVILRGKDENLGLAVDKVDSVATVENEKVDPRPLHDLESDDAESALLVDSVVRSGNDGGLIQILDVDRIFSSAGIAHREAACLDPTAASALEASVG